MFHKFVLGWSWHTNNKFDFFRKINLSVATLSSCKLPTIFRLKYSQINPQIIQNSSEIFKCQSISRNRIVKQEIRYNYKAYNELSNLEEALSKYIVLSKSLFF
jgi:hypothetical protein